MAHFVTQSTPNPNSLKITTTLGPFIDDGMVAAASLDEAEDTPLAERLLHVAGVTSVLIMPDFLTVSKQPAAEWALVLPKVKHVLADHFDVTLDEDDG
ncbi:NifU N-terminal domain-containing protein [Salisaeta longa]|uniref:NifU N-terminal domain-containing protein n=1 Tax=Salisaeta longa TaxID=503170 RepID=UPI0004068AC3|nr:NifU N-terminal domain-containing protein [Salisaeta longa]